MLGSWLRRKRRSIVVVSWTGATLAYVQARRNGAGRFEVVRHGVLPKGSQSDEEFARRLRDLGLAGCPIRVLLRPEQYQLLQIDAPQVPPDEIRAAARWKIRELVDSHLDDLTMDVCRVGDDRVRVSGQLFVLVTRNELVREMMTLGEQLQGEVQVIDVWDMAQRNLQTLLARKSAAQRAELALVVVDAEHSLLTISAYGELFYSRRIELAPDFTQARWHNEVAPNPYAEEAIGAVPEYVPESEHYDVGLGANPDLSAGQREGAQRLVVEIQRSLDVWERTWTTLPVDDFKVFAGARSAELAQWLGRELGVNVEAMAVERHFPGFPAANASQMEQELCWPLLGLLLRDEGRKV